MRETITSWNNASVTSGDVVNEVEFTYNDFGQLTDDYQNHSAAVNVLTTPKVQYGYASGSDNTIRATTITYPDGRVITYDYDSSDSMADAISRVASIVDNDGSSTHLADYSYLGQNAFVETDYTEPDIKYTLIGTAGGNDPDTGDIYRGLDRFGRIVDSYWYDYGSSADVDRIKYGYGRSGNRLWRENVVARSLGKYFDEKYLYDEIHRLKDMERGELTSGQSTITNLQFAQCWGLDESGNWSNFREDDDGNGSWNLNQDRTANKVNEISGITETTGPSWTDPEYSKAGNMTTVPKPADPTTSFTATYDAWNRLTKLVDTSSSDTVAEYEYDGAKRRTIQKSYDAGTLDETRHLYYTQPSQWQVIEERVNSSTDPDRQFIWGLRYIDDLILRGRDTTNSGTVDESLYALQDANWNVTTIVNTVGDTQQRFNYYSYGAPSFLNASFDGASDLNAWEILYGAYRYESQTTLFHVRNRSYHCSIGVWVQRDSLAYSDRCDLYRYVKNNPITLLDPSGQVAPAVAIAIAAGITVAELEAIAIAAGATGLIACMATPGCTAAIRSHIQNVIQGLSGVAQAALWLACWSIHNNYKIAEAAMGGCICNPKDAFVCKWRYVRCAHASTCLSLLGIVNAGRIAYILSGCDFVMNPNWNKHVGEFNKIQKRIKTCEVSFQNNCPHVIPSF